MKNEIKLDHDNKIAVVKLAGDQTEDSIQVTIKEIFKHNEQQMNLFGSISTLVDISELGEVDNGAKAAAVEGIGATIFDRLAVIDPDGDHEAIITTIITLAGQSARVKFFTSRDEAIAWLNS